MSEIEENPSWSEVISDDEANDAIERSVDVENKTSKAQGCCQFVSLYDKGFKEVQDDPENYFNRGCSLLRNALELDEPECIINCVRNSYMTVCALKNYNLLSERFYTHYVDLFFRVRHDLLFKSFMKALGLDVNKSDMKFSDMFDIDSDMTPDFIHKNGDDVIVIEVTVTSNIQRAAQSKGAEEFGFIGKYDREICMLKNLGYSCSYVVVIFDSADQNNQDYKKTLRELGTFFSMEVDRFDLHRIEIIRKEFCLCSTTFYSTFGVNISRLFNPDFSIKIDRSSEIKDFLDMEKERYSGRFKVISISQSLFDNVNRAWSRLHKVLENSESVLGNVLMSPSFDYSSSKFSFDQDFNGKSFDEWMIIFIYEDKASFCKHLRSHYKGSKVEVLKADIEFFYYEPNIKTMDNNINLNTDIVVFPHMNMTSLAVSIAEDIKFQDFENHVSNWASAYENEKIELELNDMIDKFDKISQDEGIDNALLRFDGDLLAKKTTTSQMCDLAIEKYNSAMAELNPQNLATNMRVFHAKQPFIYPVRMAYPESYSDYKTRPDIILSALSTVRLGGYTDRIVAIITNYNHEWGTRGREKSDEEIMMFKRLKQAQGALLQVQKEYTKIHNLKKVEKAKNVPGTIEFISKIREIQSEIKKKYGNLNIDRKTVPAIRLKTSGKSLFSEAFKSEMLHFKGKDERATYKGVGDSLDFEHIAKVYESLKDELLSPSSIQCPDDLFDNNTRSEDIGLLTHLKKDYIENYQGYYKWIRNTNLYHTCAFISRYCHTLLYLSQTTLSSDYVSVDNLGYSDCLLIVKGGKKIFPTKRTKLHRLIYPVSSNVCELFFPPNAESSFIRFEHLGRPYMVTPWISLHETIVTDGLCNLSKLMGFALMSYKNNIPYTSSLNDCYFNIFLAIHARRQTEVCLHNLRYIMVNCLSELTALDTMLPEFAGFNYDSVQYYIRESIKKKFKDYFEQTQKIKKFCVKGNVKDAFKTSGLRHLFNGHLIDDLEKFSMSVYSTYLMPKAPITQSLEQVSNLKEILKTHELFLKQSSNIIEERKLKNYKTKKDDIFQYKKDLWESDFNFDPSYMIHLGKFAADYLKNKISKSDLEIEWSKELNNSWDKLSNSSGLRGEGKDFFGRKGYFVVYDEIIKEPGFNDFLSKLHRGEINEKYLKKVNQTYRSQIAEKELNKVVFHVVDKVQRGGKREIFVMDKKTKIHQQVIEGFMSTLCKQCPTEMISIPSNRRLHTVHSRVFETKHDEGNEQYYWVLDCRKWAPRSMLEKFVYFISGMRGFLPESFLQHCYNFFHLMLNKQTHTRPHIVDILKKSKSNDWVDLKWLIKDEHTNSVYFEMSYSWMMGIFNYFSSFVHVANQLHASHMIYTTTMKNYQSFCTISPIAHSDDSAAKQSIKDSGLMKRSIMIYEILLKSANHMLSQKKSNVGKIYFEFISILYMKGELLPLLPKFLGGFNFHPTDGGYCNDILDSYSKVIDLVQNGATFQQAYMSMKIQSYMIWRFYFGSGRRFNYELPPQMFGSPDAHPICVMLSGSDADTLRLVSSKDGIKKLNKLNYIYESLALNDETDFTIYKPISIKPDIRPNNIIRRHLEFVPEGIELSWSIKNVNFNNTYIDALQYLFKLKDPNFLASLQDDNITRRISRSYYFREYNVIKTRLGDMSQSNLMKLITAAYNVDDKDFFSTLQFEGSNEVKDEILNGINSSQKNIEIIRLLHSELIGLFEYWKHMDYDEDNLMVNKKTTKPVHINLQKVTGGIGTKFEPSILCSWIKEPAYRNLLPNVSGCLSAESELLQIMEDYGISLDDVPIQTLYHVLRKIKSKTFSNIYCYGNVPSGLREINTYQDLTLYLAHNSFEDRFINGLTLPLGRMVNVSAAQIMPEFKLDEVQTTCAMMNIILAGFNSMNQEAFEDFLKLDIKTPNFLNLDNMETIKISEFSDKVQNFWKKRPLIGCYFHGLLKIVDSLCSSKRIDGSILKGTFFHSFIKRQTLIQDRWMGVGQIFINLGNVSIVLVLKGKVIDKIIVPNNTICLNKMQVNYINYVLSSSESMSLIECMKSIPADNLDIEWFGVSYEGEYKIAKGRSLKHYISSLIIEPTLQTRLSNFDRLEVKILPRLKLEALYYDELIGKQKFIINIMTVDTEKSIYIARKMIADTKQNEMITNFWNSDKESYIIDLISEGLEVDMYTNPREVFMHYEYTKLFEIMQVSEKMEISKIKNVSLRAKTFPAQEGGLLNTLIQYQMNFNDFPFNWDRIITPELMSIKSSQPEAFMTGLVDRIDERYNALYSSEEKQQIIRELYKIMNTINEPSKENELMAMLSNWGYTGVAGAMKNIEKNEDFEAFKIFREYNVGFSFLTEFGNIFVKLIKAMINTILDDPSIFLANYVSISNLRILRLTQQNLKSTIISLLHTYVMSLYTKNPGLPSLNVTFCDIFFYESMITFFTTDSLLCKFKEEMQEHYLLSSLECNMNSRIHFFTSYRALLHCFRHSRKIGISIDPDTRRLQSTSFTLPMVKTKEIGEEVNLKFNIKKANYNGLCSDEFLTRLHTSYNISFGGTNYSIWFKKTNFRSLPKVKYHPSFHFKFMLNEDFVDSEELEEINIELSGASPCLDEINGQIDNFLIENESIYDKSGVFYRIIRGKKIKQVKVSVINLLGYVNVSDYMQFYRQAGNDILLLTNTLFIPLVCGKANFMFFQFNDPEWYNKSLNKHDHIWGVVLSENIKQPQVWEQTLNARYFDRTQLKNLVEFEKLTISRTSAGSDIDSYKLNYMENDDANDIWNSEIDFGVADIKKPKQNEMQTSTDKLENNDQEENEFEKKISSFESKLFDMGFEEGSTKQFMEIYRKSHESKNEKQENIFLGMIKKLFEKQGFIDRISEMSEGLLKMPLTEEQLTRIFQVPFYFGKQISKDSTIKNNALKDKKLYAEIESLTGGLCTKIISGTLTITERMYDRVKTNIRMCNKIIRGTTQNKKQKRFLIDFYVLILNDAHITFDSNTTEEWSEIMALMSDFVMSDEDDDDIDNDIYNVEVEKGRIPYRLAGDSARLFKNKRK